MDVQADGKTAGSLSAVVTRANGRVENMGLIAFRHPNPIIHFIVNGWIKLKRFIRG